MVGSARPASRWTEMHVNDKTELNLYIRILNLRRDPHASGLRRLDELFILTSSLDQATT